jgi:hypothetical protein
MGYGFYTVSAWDARRPSIGTRPAGYMVLATCDKRGCHEEIDRGLSYLCGDDPHGPMDDAPGCGRYFCGKHSTFVGPRGGCPHRGKRAWGRTLSCMVSNVDGSIVCLDRAGHDTPHAWEIS